MNKVSIFEHPEFGRIRTLEIDGKIWFCASDVAAALGYSNPRDAVVRHCKPMGVVVYDTPTRSAVQKIKYISEGNVYRLIAGSKLPSAEKFESWIFDELVPETLKNGGYLLKKNGETDNELLARAILLAQNRIKERDSRISALEKENNYAILKLKLQAPKVQYYDKVLQSQSTYTTTQIAKELGMTAGMLNKRLRWAGIQFRQSGQWLLKAPYQNQGYTATRTHVWESRTGETGTAMLTVWTEKGRLFIHYSLYDKTVGSRLLFCRQALATIPERLPDALFFWNNDHKTSRLLAQAHQVHVGIRHPLSGGMPVFHSAVLLLCVSSGNGTYSGDERKPAELRSCPPYHIPVFVRHHHEEKQFRRIPQTLGGQQVQQGAAGINDSDQGVDLYHYRNGYHHPSFQCRFGVRTDIIFPDHCRYLFFQADTETIAKYGKTVPREFPGYSRDISTGRTGNRRNLHRKKS